MIKALFGLLFLALAVKQWRSRPAAGAEPSMPKWMATIDSFSSGKSLGIAALLAGVNPKNLGLTVAAGLTIAQSGLSGSQSWVALAVFVLVWSVTVLIPVIYYIAAGGSATKTLTTWKTWLSANNATVMTVLFVVFGVKLLGDGLGGGYSASRRPTCWRSAHLVSGPLTDRRDCRPHRRVHVVLAHGIQCACSIK